MDILECKYCNKVYNVDSHMNGTSTLHIHENNCKNPHNEETRQKLLFSTVNRRA